MDQYKYAEVGGKTSVKVHHQPGGNSNFSLGWGDDSVPKNGGKGQVSGFNAVNQSNNAPQQQQQQPGQQQQFSGQYSNQSFIPQQQQPPSQGFGGRPGQGGNVYPEPGQPQQQQAWSGPSSGPQGAYAKQDVQTSVKVQQNPGGRQQFNIFGGDEPAQDDRFARQGQYGNAKQPQQKQGDQWGAQPNTQQQSKDFWEPARQEQPRDDRWSQQNAQKQQQPGYGQQQQQQYPPQQQQQQRSGNDGYNPISQQQQQYPPQQQARQGYQPSGGPDTFGQRVESGNQHSAINGVSSVKLHAPPGGRSQIQLI